MLFADILMLAATQSRSASSAASLGPELIADPTFATGYTNIRNTSVSGGVIHFNGSTSPACTINLTAALDTTKSYELIYTTANITTELGLRALVGGAASTSRSDATPQTYTEIITGLSSADTTIRPIAGTSSVLDITSVSLKQVLP